MSSCGAVPTAACTAWGPVVVDAGDASPRREGSGGGGMMGDTLNTGTSVDERPFPVGPVSPPRTN